MARHLIAIVDDIHASATSLTVRSMDAQDYEQAVADGLDGGDLADRADLMFAADAPVGLDGASIEAATDIVADLILLAGGQWADILRIATDHANRERRQRGGNV
jgi:hypothetical protein